MCSSDLLLTSNDDIIVGAPCRDRACFFRVKVDRAKVAAAARIYYRHETHFFCDIEDVRDGVEVGGIRCGSKTQIITAQMLRADADPRPDKNEPRLAR